ncbi:putative MFS-type transporter YwoD [Lentibacillus populi]|uniref:MFS-type transporter YwoD n=1 Tax=Lentibacillus populi TaxID=1827502 RepID=A0A9W5TXZ3_9BACI|nr:MULTISPECIES: MFS transporter [Bacillaceae]MBT2218273.1 MFS transporter [Virgibacillus dakarensis]GGB42647.1 putative MFS-type transporter YwoD [Lentibacillus populi]
MKETLQKPWLLVLTIGLGTLLNPLNSSMISVALTRLQHEFSLTFADASWLISIFYLASAAAQPVMGKLSDMFGPKRLFLTGLILVAGAAILAPFSPNYPFLLGCRALMAIGSSTLFPSGMSMVRTNITEGQGKALAALSIFASTSAAFGPSIGGFLIASWDWQSIFIINFPFIVLSFVMAIFILPAKGQGKIELNRIDFSGIALFIVAMIGLILFLLSLENQVHWSALMVFLLAAIGFYFCEKNKREPFIDLVSLKRNPNVTFVYLQFTSINLIYYCYFFGFPTFLQQVRHYSEEHTGLIMLALAGFSVIVAPVAGRMIDRYGSKLPLVIGAFLLLTGTALLLTFQQDSTLLWFIAIMAVLGMSNGFNNISMQTALYEQVKPEETGSASGLFQTSRYLGSILSSCLLGLAFNSHLDIEHLHIIAGVSLVFCILVIVLALRLPGQKLLRSR